MIEPEDDRPWEQPGEFRRDCEPHQGPVLLWFSKTLRILALFGACLPPLVLLYPIFAVVALVLIRADETEIRHGRMDPEGLPFLQAARQNARIALFVSLFWAAFLGGYVLLALNLFHF